MKKWRYWYNNIIARKKSNQRKFPYYKNHHSLFDWISSTSSWFPTTQLVWIFLIGVKIIFPSGRCFFICKNLNFSSNFCLCSEQDNPTMNLLFSLSFISIINSGGRVHFILLIRNEQDSGINYKHLHCIQLKLFNGSWITLLCFRRIGFVILAKHCFAN